MALDEHGRVIGKTVNHACCLVCIRNLHPDEDDLICSMCPLFLAEQEKDASSKKEEARADVR